MGEHINGHDAFVLGMGLRALADRQAADQEKVVYSNQVAGLLAQGYTLEQAHSQVQDFYQRQAQMQAQIAAHQRQQQMNPLLAWTILLVGGFLALCLLGWVIGLLTGNNTSDSPIIVKGDAAWCANRLNAPHNWPGSLQPSDGGEYDRLCIGKRGYIPVTDPYRTK